MSKSKRMPKYIKSIVEGANRTMQRGTLKENEKLFYFVSDMLLKKGCYRGFNLYCWDTLSNGDKWLKLAGADKDHRDAEGHFKEKETDVRQFYVW